MSLRIGIGTNLRIQGSSDWASYWANSGSFLFFASDPTNILNKVSATQLPNQVTGATDYLTVTGTGLNARYRTPDNATYRAADTDYVFWKSDASESICDGNRLIGYDFPRILVKYLNVAPYTILWIGILKPGSVVTNAMRDSFDLSVWWDNTLSAHGALKQNKPIAGQYVWTPESVAGAPTVTTTAISAITNITASSGGDVTDDGGDTVTARGVCWSTSANPTTANSKTTNGTGEGAFTSAITGLIPGVTYHVRAYATNSFDTSYGSDVQFTATIKDASGNSYTEVVIGGQTWLVENLKTAKYNDDSAIPIPSGEDWIIEDGTPGHDGARCWVNNDNGNTAVYGFLYNWYAVNNAKGIAPLGYHVPTLTEINTLMAELGGTGVAGGHLKEAGTTHWTTPNTGADNSSEFTALPGGYRNGVTFAFDLFLTYNIVFTATTVDANNANRFYLANTDDNMVVDVAGAKKDGYTIRCIKN